MANDRVAPEAAMRKNLNDRLLRARSGIFTIDAKSREYGAIRRPSSLGHRASTLVFLVRGIWKSLLLRGKLVV